MFFVGSFSLLRTLAQIFLCALYMRSIFAECLACYCLSMLILIDAWPACSWVAISVNSQSMANSYSSGSLHIYLICHIFKDMKVFAAEILNMCKEHFIWHEVVLEFEIGNTLLSTNIYFLNNIALLILLSYTRVKYACGYKLFTS